MKTDDLIRALTADGGTRGPTLISRLMLGLAVAWGLSAIPFALILGPRPDFSAVVGEPRFELKFVVVLLLAAAACTLLLRLARPGAETQITALMLLASPAALLIGVAWELISVPTALWGTKLVGTNAQICLTYVPLLALLPLAAALAALRSGAPTRPTLAGGVAGLLAGGLGAALYASHCTDDSPLFVMAWYTLAIALVAGIGALIGRIVLRW